MVEQDQFRQVMGNFATGVTVVTTTVDGDDHAMTVNSFASVSLDPPLVLFNADKGTTSHDLIAESERYAVNVLSAEQEWLSNRFAGEHKEMDDPWEDVTFRREATGSPIVEEAICYMDCTLTESYDGGDHTIYLGHVEEMGVQEPDAAPLTFFRGQYGTIE
ncbi:flavin reductase family protein [Halorarum halobium]|uniref:flavin reductase family protein n=1 Tax=Halorarum halobium TaxID=3075121 RepID=UPI0028B2323A|nr:flavin reductase family protein [Halobaculum sp. XH14]